MTSTRPSYRRTKIVATIGPASSSEPVLGQLLEAGTDVFRLNFSHGSPAQHQANADRIRRLSRQLGREVALLGDLQGPKIRIRSFADKAVELRSGEPFTLDCELPDGAGNAGEVGVDLESLPECVVPGDTLLLDDGRLSLQVEAVTGRRVVCRVVLGGLLSDRKGLNKLGGGLSAPALTEKDKNDLANAATLGLDYLAVSFPSRVEDILQARELLGVAGSEAGIIAKIERAEAVEAGVLDALIEASDGVMVARGDLGVEVGDAALVGFQKQIISRARRLDRTVITATQMMESMIHSPIPTRAEVFDVANAVLDGTDAVMLSAETATGEYPVQTVEAMSRTCIGAEQQREIRKSSHRIDRTFHRVDEAIALSAVYAANHLEAVAGIICLTESGATPLWASRLSSGLPIFACSRNEKTLRRVSLFRGVTPIRFDPTEYPATDVAKAAISVLKERGLVRSGDRLILTRGSLAGVGGNTTTLQIGQVE